MRAACLGLTCCLLSISLVLSGCTSLRKTLRPSDDEEYAAGPTVGGVWPEGGLLADSYERSPASDKFGGATGRQSWVDERSAEENLRDRYRSLENQDGETEAPDSENTPVISPSVKRLYKHGNRATRDDFIDQSTNEGSLWASDGQTNYYFTKNKIRGVGDIVTINLDEGMTRDIANELKKTLTDREKEIELVLAQERIKNQALGIPEPGAKATDKVSTSGAAPTRDGAAAKENTEKKEEIQVREATYADIDLTKAIQLKAGDTMVGEIIDRYPNGNYKIRSSKRVSYRGSMRMVSLLAIVKGADIGEDDKIDAGKLYEYRLEAIR